MHHPQRTATGRAKPALAKALPTTTDHPPSSPAADLYWALHRAAAGGAVRGPVERVAVGGQRPPRRAVDTGGLLRSGAMPGLRTPPLEASTAGEGTTPPHPPDTNTTGETGLECNALRRPPSYSRATVPCAGAGAGAVRFLRGLRRRTTGTP